MQSKKITIKDIALKARVSIGTVDRVIHNRGEVKEDTRKQILSIIDELGYTPNLLAKTLALKRLFRICVLIPRADSDNPYWSKPLTGLESAAEEIKKFNFVSEIHTYAIDSKSAFEKKLKQIIMSEPDGIVFTPHFTEETEKMTLLCNEKKIPVIFLDSNIETAEVLGYIGQDATSSGSVAARLMCEGIEKKSTVLILKLAKNKSTLAHLTKREKGFLDFLSSNSHLMIKHISLEIELSDDKKTEQAILRHIKETKNLKGIFVTNSRVHRVARIVKENKLEHLNLIGYDLINENIRYLREGVISFLVCQKPEEQGYRSLMILFNHLFANKPVSRVNHSPVDILIRENLAFYGNTM
jgi:LacI family transcriptional regulator